MIHPWFDALRHDGLGCVLDSRGSYHPLKILFIQPLVKNLSKHHVLSDGLPVYRRLQSDDQDSVRLLTVEDLIVIAQQLSPSEVKEQLLKQIRHSVADKSWRVRYMAATHFNEVCYNQNPVTNTDKPSLLACRGGWCRVG